MVSFRPPQSWGGYGVQLPYNKQCAFAEWLLGIVATHCFLIKLVNLFINMSAAEYYGTSFAEHQQTPLGDGQQPPQSVWTVMGRPNSGLSASTNTDYMYTGATSCWWCEPIGEWDTGQTTTGEISPWYRSSTFSRTYNWPLCSLPTAIADASMCRINLTNLCPHSVLI